MPRTKWIDAVAFGLVIAVLILNPGSARAEITSAGILDDVLARYNAAAHGWSRVVQGAATRLFWSLALISLVWTFAEKALRQADLVETIAELVRYLCFTGFFWWLLENAPAISEAILASMRQLGAEAAGVKNALTPSSIVDVGFGVVFKVFDQNWMWSPGDSLVGALMALVILVLLALVAANMLMLLVASWFLAYAGIFFLGFGGSRWTSEIAVGYYKHLLSIGAQLFAMVLLVGISQTFLDSYYAQLSEGVKLKEMAVMLIVALVLLVVCNRVTAMISGLASGMHASHAVGHGAGAGAALSALGIGTAAVGGAVGLGAAMVKSTAANVGGAVQAMRAATGAARVELGAGAGGLTSGGFIGGVGKTNGAPGPLAGALGESPAKATAASRPFPLETSSAQQRGGTSPRTGERRSADAGANSDGSSKRGAVGSGHVRRGTNGSSVESGFARHESSGAGATRHTPASNEHRSTYSREEQQDPAADVQHSGTSPAEQTEPDQQAASDQAERADETTANAHNPTDHLADSGEDYELEGTLQREDGETSSASRHQQGSVNSEAEVSEVEVALQTDTGAIDASRDPRAADTSSSRVSVSRSAIGRSFSADSQSAALNTSGQAHAASAETAPRERPSEDHQTGAGTSKRRTIDRTQTAARTASADPVSWRETIGTEQSRASASTSPRDIRATNGVREVASPAQGSTDGPAAAPNGSSAEPSRSAEPSTLRVAARATQILAQAAASHIKDAALGAAKRRVDASLGGRIASAIRTQPREPPAPSEVAAFRDIKPSESSDGQIESWDLPDLENTKVALDDGE